VVIAVVVVVVVVVIARFLGVALVVGFDSIVWAEGSK
jgi:hypothetical protein